MKAVRLCLFETVWNINLLDLKVLHGDFKTGEFCEDKKRELAEKYFRAQVLIKCTHFFTNIDASVRALS